MNTVARPRPDSLLDLKGDQVGGEADNFSLVVKSISIGSGKPIDIPHPGVTLIVGGNNAGKSTLLRQMHGRLTAGWASPFHPTPALLTSQLVSVTGTQADVISWLAANSAIVEGGFQRNGTKVGLSAVSLVWSNSLKKGQLDSVGQALTLAPNARTRFDMTLPAQRRPDIADAPSHPLHYFEDSPALFAELDSYSNRIFGTGLTLDQLSGQIMLRFGQVEVEVPKVGSISPEYREALIQLSTIDKQGDGVGSTLGLLIPLLAGRNPVAFVDEPEAFLHPPQAFKLGATVAEIAWRHGSQVIVATHDRNFVAGVLSRADVDSAVIRLDRSDDEPRAHSVEPESLRKV